MSLRLVNAGQKLGFSNDSDALKPYHLHFGSLFQKIRFVFFFLAHPVFLE